MRQRVKIDDKKVEIKFVEVKAVWEATEANFLLQKGWTLLFGGVAHQTSDGYQAKSLFILGLQGKENKK